MLNYGAPVPRATERQKEFSFGKKSDTMKEIWREKSNLTCLGYDTKLHLMVRLQFLRSGEVEVTSSLLQLSGSLWPWAVVSVRVITKGQMHRFENYSYSIGILNNLSSSEEGA